MAQCFVGLAVLFALVLGVTPAASSPASVCLGISATDEPGGSTTGDAWTGDRILYIWTASCIERSGGSEFELIGDFEIVDLVPRSGVTNLGTASSPVLRYSTCIVEPTVVAALTVRDVSGEGGQLCFGDPDGGIFNCSYPCDEGECAIHVAAYGFATAGFAPCPLTVAATTSSWTLLKAVFR